MPLRKLLPACLYIIILLLGTMTGCSIRRTLPQPVIKIEGSSDRFRRGEIIDLEKMAAISFETLIRELASQDLIFIGEVHNNPEHHLIQLQILQAITSKEGPPDTAMEFFEKQTQPVIDRYLSGLISEKQMLQETGWDEMWGFDYSLYRPIALHIKHTQGKMLGINARNDLVKKVARSGLEGLPPEERRQLPREIDLNNSAHRGYIERAFKAHRHPDLKDFDFFYQAQCVWEETMAENIALHWDKNKGRMVILAGNGHLIHGYGIPDRTLKRIDAESVTLLLYPMAGSETLKKEAADYVWLTGSCSRIGRMGR